MCRTDNPVSDWDRYCAEEERKLARLPVCGLCVNPIVDDEYYEIDEKIICPECLKENYRKWTEDYIESED